MMVSIVRPIAQECMKYLHYLIPYRHFLATITTLKQFKTPAIEINLKSKNTFLAQNQQLNINPKEKNDENIKPK